MKNKMEKEIRSLKIYAVILTGAFFFIIASSFTRQKLSRDYKILNVERINIVEPDGKLKMVISNQNLQHPGMIDGKELPARERAPGILFFNEEQDEVGGLGYYGNQADGGNNVYLSIDQYKNDQVMQLMHYTSKNGDNRYGLQFWERDKELTQPVLATLIDSLDQAGYNYPEKMKFLQNLNGGEPVTASRMFVGKNYNRETGVFLKDQFGVDRLRLYVDSANNPRLEWLDSQGQVMGNLLNPSSLTTGQ